MDNSTGMKETLEYFASQIRPTFVTKTVDKEMCKEIYATEEMHLVASEPKEFHYTPLKITTLTGFIDYIKENRDALLLEKTIVQVTDAAGVRLISTPSAEKYEREIFIEANALLPKLVTDRFIPVEEFIIMLQAVCVDSPDREVLLKYIGNIEESESVTTVDDGVSQRITAKTGVASVDTVVLPNPVTLRPYRTFQELNQPESEFVLRVRSGGQVAIFEADGGAWKVTCRALIKAALTEALKHVEGICIIS